MSNFTKIDILTTTLYAHTFNDALPKYVVIRTDSELLRPYVLQAKLLSEGFKRPAAIRIDLAWLQGLVDVFYVDNIPCDKWLTIDPSIKEVRSNKLFENMQFFETTSTVINVFSYGFCLNATEPYSNCSLDSNIVEFEDFSQLRHFFD